MKLIEIKEVNGRKIYTAAEEIDRWFAEISDIRSTTFKYEIQPDGTVNGLAEIVLSVIDIKQLPVNFGTIDGNFFVSMNMLTSLEGCPKVVRGLFSCSKNPQLTSLTGCPRHIERGFYCHETGIESLEGISDMIEFIGGAITVDFNKIKTSGIGLILISGLTNLLHRGGDDHIPRWVQIINSYLGRPEDIFECQAKLIEEGYEQHAIL